MSNTTDLSHPDKKQSKKFQSPLYRQRGSPSPLSKTILKNFYFRITYPQNWSGCPRYWLILGNLLFDEQYWHQSKIDTDKPKNIKISKKRKISNHHNHHQPSNGLHPNTIQFKETQNFHTKVYTLHAGLTPTSLSPLHTSLSHTSRVLIRNLPSY